MNILVYKSLLTDLALSGNTLKEENKLSFALVREFLDLLSVTEDT